LGKGTSVVDFNEFCVGQALLWLWIGH
jgi:hypothetical protein